MNVIDSELTDRFNKSKGIHFRGTAIHQQNG